MITINQAESTTKSRAPAGFYLRSDVSRLTDISVSTLIRWQSEGIFMPQSSQMRGTLKTWLYSESQVEDLLLRPPYQKLGRPPKSKDLKT